MTTRIETIILDGKTHSVTFEVHGYRHRIYSNLVGYVGSYLRRAKSAVYMSDDGSEQISVPSRGPLSAFRDLMIARSL